MNLKTPCIPENAPFTADQKLWLNGFLAGLFAAQETAAPEAPPKPVVPLLILFGSQTGTAQNLARRFAQDANSRGCRARVVDATAHTTVEWSTETNLLVITSTYGDGDMPDNAQDFWKWLQSDAAQRLAHLHFSVLALGDRNYAEFCAAGRKIDARLEQIGARRVHPRTDCDVDYETPARDWLQAVLNALAPAPSTSPTPAPTAAPAGHSQANPFPAPMLANRALTGDGSLKETRHLEFSIEGSGLSYEAGDAFGIYPSNCPLLVSDILAALNCDGEEAVPSPGGSEMPLRKALKDAYDITRPPAALLQRFAEQNPEVRDLLAPGRETALRDWLRGREIIDLLLQTPAIKFAPADFVALLRKLAPRLYSISSSPKAHPGQVHLTAGVVRYESHGRGRKGVCSTFLAERTGPPATVPAFIHSSPGFRLPPGGDTAIIMVGPGTGIAPFRGFLHDRRATGAKGRNWLFFGEQHAGTDFFYRDELTQMVADGHLSRLSTAFSRDQAEKIYVQHRLLESAAELWPWLREGAHFYVCGDASRMARDVDAALHQVIATAGGLGKEGAEEYVTKMKSEKRYQRDVY